MVHLFRKKADTDIFFSEEGTAELLEYHRRVVESFDMAVAAFDEGDAQLARGVVELVDYLRRVDSYTESIARTVLEDPATTPSKRTAGRGAD